jgi:hypothetical protein
MNGEGKWRELGSYHPKNGRGRRTTTRTIGALNTYEFGPDSEKILMKSWPASLLKMVM